MGLKTEYITSDGFHFPEDMKEIADKHELLIEYLKAVKSTEKFVLSCVDAAVPKENTEKNEVYVMYSLINGLLSKMD